MGAFYWCLLGNILLKFNTLSAHYVAVTGVLMHLKYVYLICIINFDKIHKIISPPNTMFCSSNIEYIATQIFYRFDKFQEILGPPTTMPFFKYAL